MAWRDCVDCGEEFETEPDKHWAKQCYSCWRQSKIDDGTWRGGGGQARSGFLGGPGVPRDTVSAEFYEHLDALVSLCHPDKHNNSERANRVMIWLLEKRNER